MSTHPRHDPGDREPTPPPQWAAAASDAVDAGTRRARATAAAVHQSEAWSWARRYLPVYRWATDLDDKTVAGLVAGGWAFWLAGGALAFALGGPGAPVVGAVLALLTIAADVAGVRWWMGYRRSPARLRHQILAREQIAAGREVADSSLAAAQVAELGEQVRPTLAARLRAGDPPRAQRRQVTMTGPVGGPRPVSPGDLPMCPAAGTDGLVR